MSSQRELGQLLAEHEDLKARFISTEISLGLTFCWIASSTQNPRTADRNAKNARRAYESAAHAFQGVHLSAQIGQGLADELAELETRIRQIDKSESHSHNDHAE